MSRRPNAGTTVSARIGGLAIFATVGAAVLPAIAQPETQRGAPETTRQAGRPDAGAEDLIAQIRRELAPSVSRAIGAAFLGDDERRAMRVRHGVWEPGDLDDPALAARAAVIRGALSDPSLSDPRAAVEDRAEGAIGLGRLDAAIALLEGVDPASRSIRAQRLLAEALYQGGRVHAADDAVGPIVSRLLTDRSLGGDDLAEGVRALMIRDRVRGAVRGSADYTIMLSLLAKSRDEVDRLGWRARLAEAELLYEKSSRAEAMNALRDAIAHNPSSARAWRLMGELMIDQFNFEALGAITARLDALAHQPFATQTGDAPERHATSLHSALLNARARLRQSDGDGAALALLETDPAYERNRELLAWTAAAAAAVFDDAETDRLLAELDALNTEQTGTPRAGADRPEPGTAHGLLAVGRTLAEMRQYGPAAERLEAAAARLPNWAPPVLHLGLLEVQSGRDGRARDALTRAVELDPFNVRAANSLTLVEELQAYTHTETEHFVIRHRAGIDDALAADMPAILERIHERVTGPDGFDHEPADRTVIELMPDHEWFSVRITGMPAIHTVAASTGPVIAFESPQQGAGFSIGHYDWPRVLQHEYAHTVTLSRTGNRIPHWFTEAAAVHIEDAPRDYNTWQLLTRAHATGTLFDLEQINIAFVRPEKPTDRAQAYAQGHWMYQYIVDTWGPRAPLDLMDRFAAGTPLPAAFPEVLGEDAEDFLIGFEAWAHNQLIEVGMLLPQGTPSVGELRERDGVDPDTGEPAPIDAGFAVRWLAEYPGHPDLLELAAASALEARAGLADDETVHLLELYAQARPVDPMPHRALARHFLAKIDELPGGEPGTPEAEALISRVVENLSWLDARAKYEPVFSVQLARLHGRTGDLVRAANAAERAVQMAPFDADHRELAAASWIRLGDYQSGRRHIGALRILEPDRPIHDRRLEAIDRMIADQG